MTTAYHQPLLIKPDKSVIPLHQIDLSAKSVPKYDEKWLQELLYQHPEALPIAEIDASYAGLIPLCMEMDTPAGPVDVLYATPTGRLALLETKLWRNSEARRKVIAQLLDYATQIARWDYSRLESAVRQARQKLHPEQPFEALGAWVTERASDLSEQRFNDAISKTLSKGDFLLIIAGDGIREGAGAIAQFLDRNGGLHFSFGLIECAIYEGPDGSRLLQPRVIAQTAIVERTFVRIAPDQLVEQEAAPTDDDEVEPAVQASRAKYHAYWEQFLKKVTLEDSQPISEPANSANQFFMMPKGSDAWVSAYLAESRDQAGVYLTFAKGANGARLFKALEDAKGDINSALGLKPQWRLMPDGRQRVLVKGDFPGLFGKSRQASQEWLADMTQRSVSVFRPRIEALLHAPK